MPLPPIPVVNYTDLTCAHPMRRQQAIQTLGQALETIGFLILDQGPVAPEVVRRAHQTAAEFFTLPDRIKGQYDADHYPGQGGFSGFGTEQAKHYTCPDLKEFWHVSYRSFEQAPAPWPTEVPQFRPIMTRLYQQLLACAHGLLEACALYLGQPQSWLADMARGGNTILRLAHYPPIPLGAPAGSLRAAPHEDINLITLLCEATAPGLEILSHDGRWLPIQATPGQIVVDTGDMLQNLTNGLIKSTTHRVSNPRQGNQRRLSMPFFVHPRPEIDLSPHAAFLERTGGQPRFPTMTAETYLNQRLAEIKVTPVG
ncbi:isopenicillin N synthase family oxygenase [Nodosilinea sp. P-1105]|uniref:isopenicillin N synthase family dioxygenase n=1 Tax=Nodosilinea sp. P-1105 TaxID=2546229 RepID=UPI00146A2501|nr:isopenicillin N synthase family oxygenase [Nodosilinea sp. P-1105]NMF84951.1 isopenicillin N synthase family oxygenase [Nodosilinea sp. P-1105]